MPYFSKTTTRWIEHGTVVLVLTLAAAFCFGKAVSFGFLEWDTQTYILRNECVHGLTLSNLKCIFTKYYFLNWHPLTSITYAIEYEVFGTNPKFFHLNNILLHILNSLLIYILARRIFEVLNMERTNSIIGAGSASVLFLVHPQHVESVVWIAERKGLLSATFSIISVLYYLRYTARKAIQQETFSFYLSLLFFLFALLAKASAIALPVVLILLDIYPLNRLGVGHGVTFYLRSVWMLIKEKLLFFLIALAIGIVTVLAQDSGGAILNLERYGLFFRIVNAIHSYYFYIVKWLSPLHLSPFYATPRFLMANESLTSYLLVGSFIIAQLILVAFWIAKRPAPFVILTIILVALLPVLGIIKIGSQAAADRYTYIPLIPLFLVFGFYVSKFFNSPLRSRQLIVALSTLGILVSFATISKAQTSIWKNDATLWVYVSRGWVGNSSLPYVSLGVIAFNNGNYEKAIEMYELARDRGMTPRFYWGLARAYAYTGEFGKSLQAYQYMLDHPKLGEEWKERASSGIVELKKLMNQN